jgi:hypothetical protein
VLGRLKLSVSISEISLPLRKVYVSVLADILEVFAITSLYIRRGSFGLSGVKVKTDIVGNYLAALVSEDDRLQKLHEHLNFLVLTEVATTTAQLQNQIGRLTIRSDAILSQVQILNKRIQEVHDIQRLQIKTSGTRKYPLQLLKFSAQRASLQLGFG